MPFITQGKTNLKYILIVVILATIAGGGILGYQYWWAKKEGSSAPGCRYFSLPFAIGGCFSKFAIIDKKVEPHIDCIELDVNNCSSPSITLRNRCSEDIFLEGDKIPSKVERCYTPLQYYYFSSKEVSLGSIPVLVDGNTFELNFNLNNGNIPSKYEGCLRFIRIVGHERLEINCKEMVVKIGEETFNPKPEVCNTYPGEKLIAWYKEAPAENTNYNVSGNTGTQDFIIFYTVTKKLCN